MAVKVEILGASNSTTSAFFKAYSKVSPKIKHIKTDDQMELVKQATQAMEQLLQTFEKGK